MISFIERKVNDICGRWLDGFTKDNVDVSVLQAKITLSDLYFKTDELCLLSPTLAPTFFYVGKLSVDIPLSFNLARPVKITVSDVLAVLRVGGHGVTPEDARKAVSANAHVKALLSRLASELGGSVVDEGRQASTISLKTALAVHKVVQNIEVHIKGAHIRLEEPEKDETGSPAETAPKHAVALGLCLREITLGPDVRANEAAGGGRPGGKWFGRNFRKMETGILGNHSLYDAVDGPEEEEKGQSPPRDTSGSKRTLTVAKYASVRGLTVYFCRDQESYSSIDRAETLLRLRAGLRAPPDTLPPLLQRCRAGLGLKVVLSASEWGKIESVDARLLAGDTNLQVADDHLGYLLRWASLLNGSMRTLALGALRPIRPSVHPGGRTLDNGGEKSRFYRALWRYAGEAVLRDLRTSMRRRGREAMKDRQWNQVARNESGDHPLSAKDSEYPRTRGRLWRMWFGEWVRAARYLSLRQLLHPRIKVEKLFDESGGKHNRLHEALELEPTAHTQAEKKSKLSPKNKAGEEKLEKYLMPWQLPEEDVDEAWDLISRKILRWESRLAGGIGLALDEEREDMGKILPAVLQALWSIQLQMDAELPHRICAMVRRMAAVRIGWRNRIDALWQARAEKQRRLGLGLGDPPAPPRLTANDSLSSTASEAGTEACSEVGGEAMPAGLTEIEGGDGADRVGTLLVRMGQLDGVGGVGVLSLAPKAVATLMLEESSATLEEMDMETNSTKVAKYDSRNERCRWDQTFRLQVELDECHVQELRRERTRKRRLSSPLNRNRSRVHSVSLAKEDGPPQSESPTEDGSDVNDNAWVTTAQDGTATNGAHGAGGDPRCRVDSAASHSSKPSEAKPHSSFLLAVSCIDKGAFGITQLGTVTLSSKELCAVSLKVLEHRCALFSPAAASRQPRELTLQTVFVPPGEDVALGEQELVAVRKRRHLQEKLDKARETLAAKAGRKQRSSVARNDPEPVPPPAPDAPEKPQRVALDEVGEHEVKVLSLEPADSDVSAPDILISPTTIGQLPSPPGGVAPRSRGTNAIPIVDMKMPGQVVISLRIAGVKLATFVNSTAALARAGHAGRGLPERDELVTLTEGSALQIEACAEMDVARGKVGTSIEMATIELRDNSLLRGTKASPVRRKGEKGGAYSPQLIQVGPVCVGAHATCLAAVEDETTSADTACSDAGLRRQQTGTTPPAQGGVQMQIGAAEWFREAWGSSLRWDWRGQVKLGAYTAELCKWRDHPLCEEVWRHFRFFSPERRFGALHDTQVLRGGTIDSSGTAQSSTWLLRAGATGLTVDVQVPTPRLCDTPCAASPGTYVYVSSSDSNAGSPIASRQRKAKRVTPGDHSRLRLNGNRFFPADAGDQVAACRPGDDTPEPLGSVLTLEDAVTDESRSDGSGRVEPDDGHISSKHAEMMRCVLERRVLELEEEVAALKKAAAVAAAVLAPTAGFDEQSTVSPDG